MELSSLWKRRSVGYVAAAAGIGTATLILSPFVEHVSGRGVAVAALLLLAVLFPAITWGTGPGLLAAVLGTACLDLFYVRPDSLTKHEWIGFTCFLLTSVLVGQLSSRAKQRAEENKVLYDRLRTSFDQASQLEAARRNERFKSALLDSLTHDFRTPLTSITAAATSLLLENDDGATNSKAARISREELLHVILQQSGRLDRFIDQMIELAKVEAAVGNEEIGAESTAVEEILAAALSRAEPLLARHRIDVVCNQELCAAVNPQAMAQVVFSLVENAAKYSPAGTTIRITATESTSGTIQVAIEDEGPGVPPELRTKIFEKFFQGQQRSDPDGRQVGLGVGLAIARGLVVAHGGKISVEDRPGGKGARFAFSMVAGTRNEKFEHTMATI